jgi:hypothetical protein
MLKIEWIDKTWREDLIWCPSQLYRKCKISDEKNQKIVTLYLRWRHDDPWTMSILNEDESDFIIYKQEDFDYFKADDFKLAEKEAEKIIEKYGEKVLAV